MRVASRLLGIQVLLVGGLSTACASAAPVRRGAAREPSESAMQRKSRRPMPIVRAAGQEPFIPQFECMEFGCPATVRCGKAVCVVTHCGSGSCRFCPTPFPDALENLVIKEWCTYGCMVGPLQVGTAYGFVPSVGKTFVGPLGCPDAQPTSELRAALGEE